MGEGHATGTGACIAGDFTGAQAQTLPGRRKENRKCESAGERLRQWEAGPSPHAILLRTPVVAPETPQSLHHLPCPLPTSLELSSASRPLCPFMGLLSLHSFLTSPGIHTGLPTKAVTALFGPWAMKISQTPVSGIPHFAVDPNPGAGATLEWKSGSVFCYDYILSFDWVLTFNWILTFHWILSFDRRLTIDWTLSVEYISLTFRTTC